MSRLVVLRIAILERPSGCDERAPGNDERASGEDERASGNDERALGDDGGTAIGTNIEIYSEIAILRDLVTSLAERNQAEARA